jgi:hypothetical protein
MFEAAKAVGATKDTLALMHGICMTDKQNAERGQAIREDKQTAAYAGFNKAADAMDQAYMLVAISCGDDVRDKLGVFSLFARNLAIEIADGKPEKFLERADEFATKYTDVGKAIRAEMEPKKKAS